MIIASLIVSVLLNCLLIWYIRESIKRLSNLWKILAVFRDDLQAYYFHIQKIYKMDIYYGEPTIESLMRQTNQILEDYTQIKYLIDDIIARSENEEE